MGMPDDKPLEIALKALLAVDRSGYSALSRVQVCALLAFHLNTRTYSVASLAVRLGTSRPATSHRTDGLVQMGLTTRVKARADRRLVSFALTDDGKDYLGRFSANLGG